VEFKTEKEYREAIKELESIEPEEYWYDFKRKLLLKRIRDYNQEVKYYIDNLLKSDWDSESIEFQKMVYTIYRFIELCKRDIIKLIQ
jgi:hypothetical protein